MATSVCWSARTRKHSAINRSRNWGGSAKFAERLGFGGTSLKPKRTFYLHFNMAVFPPFAEWPAKLSCTLRNAF